MDPTPASNHTLRLGPAPAIVYVAMLGATIAGQAAGMLVDALVLGRRLLWVPIACSVLLEAVVGARFGAVRVGRPLTAAECGRLSAYYSLLFAWISGPLALWSLASTRQVGTGRASGEIVVAMAIAVAGLLAATVARHGAMVFLSRGRT